MRKVITLITLAFSLSTFAISTSIENSGSFYEAIIKQTLKKNESSDLLELYKAMSSAEIRLDTREGFMARKVMQNSAHDMKFACVYLENYKTDGQKYFHCELFVSRFLSDSYEVEFNFQTPGELIVHMDGAQTQEVLSRLDGQSDEVLFNISDKFILKGNKEYLYFKVVE